MARADTACDALRDARGSATQSTARRNVPLALARTNNFPAKTGLIRVGWSDPVAMGKEAIEFADILRASARADERSPLFRWFYEHHDEVTAALAGRRVLWRTFCALFHEAGLTDATGKSPTARTARQTWYRVRCEVAKHQPTRSSGETSEPTARFPSRFPPGWQPAPIASAAAVPTTTPSSPRHATTPPASEGQALPVSTAQLTAAEKIARLRQKLRDRDY